MTYLKQGLLASVALSAAVLAGPAWAQTKTVDELVVTARKREESILTVPMSIAAIGADEIDRKGVKDLEELSRSVPGLVATQSPDGDTKSFLMRGVAQSFDTAATVAIYLDDTPLTVGASDAPDLKLFDVARVEVMRGPQGTLFGSNSLGGAVRYISPALDFDSVSGRVKVEAGTTHFGSANYEAQGAVGGPVAQNLAFRASAFARRDGGYVDVVSETTGLPVDKDANWVDSWGGRLALGGRVSEKVEATASVLYQQEHIGDVGAYYTSRGATPATAVPLAPFQRVERLPLDSERKFFLPNLTVNADLGFARLTSSTSYVSRKFHQENDYSYFLQGLLINSFGVDEAASNGLLTSSTLQNDQKSFVQEVRLASNPGEKFEWLVGAYYRTTTDTLDQVIDSPNLGQSFPPLDGALVFSNTHKNKSRQIAVFGEASYTVAQVLKFTAGLRLTDLKVEANQIFDGAFNGGQTVSQTSEKNRPVTPKFSVSYTPTDDLMAYVSATKGFREGGGNVPVPVVACHDDLAVLGLTAAPAGYEPDTLWSYEAGAKFRSSDHRLQFAGAVYQIDWSGIQENLGLNCGFAFVANQGAARVRGLEFEGSWRPTNDLTLDVNLGTTEGELTEDGISGADANGPVVNAPKGTALPGFPDWTANVAAQYDFPITGDWKGFVRGEYTYVGEGKMNLGGLSDIGQTVHRDAFETVAARIAISNDRYEISAFANNIFDDHTILTEQFIALAPFSGSRRSTLRPRTIGVSVAAKF